MHLVYPLLPLPKRNCITIVSNFSWILQSSQEKSNVMAMQNYGVNKVHYGLRENGEFSSFHSGSSWGNWTTRTPRGERTDGKYIHTVLHVLFDLVATYACYWTGVDSFFFRLFRVGKNGARGLFLERSGNFSGPESYFVFTVFTFRIKISIILKMIQWNYQLTKQNWLVCELLWNCATIFSARKQLLKNCF